MTKIETGNTDLLGWGARKLTVFALSPFLRAETTDEYHSIDRAKELSRHGNGLIVIINHFSYKDPPQAINKIFYTKVIGSKKIIAPITIDEYTSLVRLLGKITDVSLKPIITETTKREGKNKDLKLGEGQGDYISKSVALLKKGGIVLIAPQGARMPYLDRLDKRAIGRLLISVERAKVNNYAFLFIGLGIKGVDDYSGEDIKGLNSSKEYTVNIGACLTREELFIKRAGGNYKIVDTIIYDELNKVIPKAYRKRS